MYCSVWIFIAVALVWVECSIINGQSAPAFKNDIDNSQQPKVRSSAPRRHRVFRVGGHPPATLQYEPGTILELTCEVIGSPIPSIQWFKNGEPIDNTDDETNENLPVHPNSLGSTTSTLLISSPSPNPKDVYTCVAVSGFKEAEYSTTVFTQVSEDFADIFNMPRTPKIVTYYTFLFQDIGTHAVLPCRANGYPSSDIIWVDNYKHSIDGNSRLKVLPSGDLYLASLRWSDMGEYTCTAKNALGEKSITTFLYPMKPSA